MINKDNERLCITLKKSDTQKLKLINLLLNKRFNIELNKSQVIQHIINNYPLEKEVKDNGIKEPFKKEPSKTNLNLKVKSNNQLTKEQTDILKAESKRKLSDLKTLLNLSIKEMSELLNINFETLRDYLKGKRLPTGENKNIINDYFTKYGIN